MKLLRSLFLLGLAAIAALLFFQVSSQKNFDPFSIVPFFVEKPCASPIEYSIGSFDTKFGISQEGLLQDIGEAVRIWEDAANRNLFDYREDGALKINLLYDYRQEATDALRELGITIREDRSTYDELKAQYDSLRVVYDDQKKEYDAARARFESKSDAYNKEVQYWNSRGGAPPQEFAKLKRDQEELGRLQEAAEALRATLNGTAERLNDVVVVLNRIAASLNLAAVNYNAIGRTRGEEFDEGIYREDQTGAAIDIYQFDDANKLIRVLAHELGHALGLEHVDDPKAIMYRLNQGSQSEVAAADIVALNALCRLP